MFLKGANLAIVLLLANLLSACETNKINADGPSSDDTNETTVLHDDNPFNKPESPAGSVVPDDATEPKDTGIEKPDNSATTDEPPPDISHDTTDDSFDSVTTKDALDSTDTTPLVATEPSHCCDTMDDMALESAEPRYESEPDLDSFMGEGSQGTGAGKLTAGDIDDALNLTQFALFLEKAKASDPALPDFNTNGYRKFRVFDQNQRPLSGAHIDISSQSPVSYSNITGNEGAFAIFQSWDQLEDFNEISITYFSETHSVKVSDIPLNNHIVLPVNSVEKPGALDIALVIDATGSMRDELDYLQSELSAITERIALQYPEFSTRFAIVNYRDHDEAYLVDVSPLTHDINVTLDYLENMEARNGGDYPEAMDLALEKAAALDWQAGPGARLLFLVADAPPHEQDYPVLTKAVGAARNKGIHIYPVAASGVGNEAEYLMRSMAAYTQGRYVFLTDDSGIGNSHAQPNIACYQVTQLNALITRIIESEVIGVRVEPGAEEIIREVGNYDQGHCEQIQDIELPIHSLWSGYAEGIVDGQQQFVFTNNKAYSEYWNKISADNQPEPQVDFNTQMVLASQLGTFNYGGYQTRITRIVENSRNVVVYIENTYPGETDILPTVIESPVHLVATTSKDKPVIYNMTTIKTVP